MNTLNYAKIGISARLNLESAGERWNAVVLCRILPKGIESLREKGCQKVLRLCLMCGKNTEDGTREGSQSCEWHLLLWRKDFSVCLGWGRLWGCFHRRWNGREPWLAQPEPHFLGRNGERTPRGRRFLPGTPPSLVGACGERLYFLGYLACGPLVVTLVTARPPAGRAGDVDGYPLGEGGE